MQKRRFVFKPIHFILLIAIDLCVLAGVLIPQRSKLEAAQEELAQKTEQLNNLKIEYEREVDSLEYMKTDTYKLQQGSAKYGWHYKEDTIIPDDKTPAPTPAATGSDGTAAPSAPASTPPAPTVPATQQPQATDPASADPAASDPAASNDPGEPDNG